MHSKEVNIALFDERTRAFLTEEEAAFVDAHVPRTYRLESGVNGFTLDEVKSDKDAWIIKPADDYGAHGVYPGVDFDQEQWEHIVDDNLDAGYIVQEFYQPPRVDIINTVIDDDDPCLVESWQSMPGVYLYEGKPWVSTAVWATRASSPSTTVVYARTASPSTNRRRARQRS